MGTATRRIKGNPRKNLVGKGWLEVKPYLDASHRPLSSSPSGTYAGGRHGSTCPHPRDNAATANQAPESQGGAVELLRIRCVSWKTFCKASTGHLLLVFCIRIEDNNATTLTSVCRALSGEPTSGDGSSFTANNSGLTSGVVFPSSALLLIC